jgi:hypothetical protein
MNPLEPSKFERWAQLELTKETAINIVVRPLGFPASLRVGKLAKRPVVIVGSPRSRYFSRAANPKPTICNLCGASISRRHGVSVKA